MGSQTFESVRGADETKCPSCSRRRRQSQEKASFAETRQSWQAPGRGAALRPIGILNWKVCLTLMMTFTLCSGRVLYLPPEEMAAEEISYGGINSQNEVISLVDCQAYLCQYKYFLSCTPCDIELSPSQLSNTKQYSPPQYGPSILNRKQNKGAHRLPNRRPCAEGDFRLALLHFQRRFYLRPTGLCDGDTRDRMSTQRCGMADDSIQDDERPGYVTNDGRVIVPAYVPRGVAAIDTREDNHGNTEDRNNYNNKNENSSDTFTGRGKRSIADPISDPSLDSTSWHLSLRDTQAQLYTLRRRRDLLDEYKQDIEREVTHPSHIRRQRRQTGSASSASDGNLIIPLDGSAANRNRRSAIFQTAPFRTQETVYWRLLRNRHYGRIPLVVQRSTLRLAFRLWSEVTGLCFKEAPYSHLRDVHINIAFANRNHQELGGCPKVFDGFAGSLAHTHRKDIHFDADESFSFEPYGYPGLNSLISVAAHEIGHVIGLGHSRLPQDIMFSMMNGKKMELSAQDRIAAESIYGPCRGTFGLMTDWISTKEHRSRQYRVYNSYFFRNDIYWLYVNRAQRPRLGDPVRIETDRKWGAERKGGRIVRKGVPANLDTSVQYEYRTATGGYIDHVYFFKGTEFHKYDNVEERVVERGQIRDQFPALTPYSPTLPNNLDAAFYDRVINRMYFFKGDKVYSYAYHHSVTHGCCDSVRRIQDAFPAKRGETNLAYYSNIDTAYYSLAQSKFLIVKGEDMWEDVNYKRMASTPSPPEMVYRGKWYDTFKFVCGGDTCQREDNS